jgi:hypothetical protein
MIHYIETSLVLSLILGDEFEDRARDIWNMPSNKVSSILTQIESTIVVRRIHSRNKKNLRSNWLSNKESELKEILNQISLLKVDESIQSIIDLKKGISDCRSLDGIHVASALYLKSEFTTKKFQFYSFDKKILEVAKSLGL